MSRNDKIAAIIFSAAAGYALYRFFRLPEEDRREFYSGLKKKITGLLDNSSDTVRRVNGFMDEYDTKDEEDWAEKMEVLKKMTKDLFGVEMESLF